MKQRLRILFVDDSAEEVEWLLHELGQDEFEIIWRRGETLESLEQTLSSETWDLVLAEHSPGSFHSHSVLKLLERTHADIPCIVISDALGEEAAVEAMRDGAADYILKERVGRLREAVRRELTDSETRRKQRQAQEMVVYMAYHDTLTDLPNHNLFSDRFDQAISQALRNGRSLAVMFMDLDHFKVVNDTMGHPVGNWALQNVARRLESCVRRGDTVSRWGGDEFTLLFPELGRVEDAARIAQKILDALNHPITVDGHEIMVSGSVGIAFFPGDGADAKTVLRNADTAMYRAKEHGGTQYQFYSHAMNERASERLALEASLQCALEQDQFKLYYQPQINIHTGAVVGMEALIRWQHPEKGLILPGKFIPLAEETDLIQPIGLWALRTACQQSRRWQDEGLPAVPMAVNVSSREFQHQGLIDKITSVLAETGLDARHLELEVSESSAMHAASYTTTMLHELKQIGVGATIDNFGTGYSSLSALSRFSFHKFKIDQSFIRAITHDDEARSITRSIILLAKSLERRVVAEGVETEGQLDMLRSRGCDEVQGFYYSKPLSADETARFLREKVKSNGSAPHTDGIRDDFSPSNPPTA